MKAKPEEAPTYQLKHTIDDFKTDYWSILETQSVTGETGAMMEEIIRQLDEIKGVTWYKDDYGNVYAVKGKLKGNDKYPAFVSHTDTVHKLRNTFYVARSENGNYYAYSEDDNEFQQVGIGGDDKCGIIICLEMLHRLKTVKCAFFLDEESGCKGSAAGDLTFFDDCRYAIQIDRKGNSDIITNGSGVQLCSKEFETLLSELGKTFVYETTSGLNTDVVQLKKRGLKISACNLSAGYYNPHTKQEYINEIDLIAVMELCLAISRIKTEYPHTYEAPKYESKSYSGTKSTGGSYSGYNNHRYSPPPRTVEKLCLLCTKPTTYMDGKMCQQCVRSNLQIVVKGEDKTLEVEVPLAELNDNTCKKCDCGIYTAFEIKAGLCCDCSDMLCALCGLLLSNQTEYRRKICKQCYLADEGDMKSNYDRVIDVCPCGSFLEHYHEKEAGMCGTCIAFESAVERDYNAVYDNRCPSRDCGRVLESELEKQNELCNECVLEMAGV